jgi:hypothetical protein
MDFEMVHSETDKTILKIRMELARAHLRQTFVAIKLLNEMA